MADPNGRRFGLKPAPMLVLAATMASIVYLLMFLIEQARRSMTSTTPSVVAIPAGIAPGFSLKMQISAQDRFIQSVADFGRLNGFSLRVLRAPEPINRTFLTLMKGEFYILCSDKSNVGASDLTFGVTFHQRGLGAQPHEVFSNLIDDFKKSVENIPGLISIYNER